MAVASAATDAEPPAVAEVKPRKVTPAPAVVYPAGEPQPSAAPPAGAPAG